LKEARPGVRLGVCGCVGQQHGKALLDRIPYLDLVFGPDNLADLPGMISALDHNERVTRTTRMSRRDYRFVPLDPASEPGPTAFLTLMKGCDKVCSYCIVPHVRGREVSKPSDVVESEVRALVAGGVRDVTLLGQNVNSYGKDRPGEADFVTLLERLDAIPGLARLRFVTSHPADADRRMMSVFGRLGTVCEYLHLPVQSGSDRVLKAMRRGYTAAAYLEKLAWAREAFPDLAISTDVIVGFPSETPEDFDATLRLVEAARFDAMFSFKYSPRPHTTAFRLEDDVPQAGKSARLRALAEIQDRIGAERSARFLGRRERILVEGLSRAATGRGRPAEWTGRTRTNRIVNFDASGAEPPVPGQELDVLISEVLPHSLRGTLVAAPAGEGMQRLGEA
jgi:tRNA-2-methylthio-N6-dimethylallyladenosine synthase